MTNSIFSSQFQTSLYQLLWQLMDNLEKNNTNPISAASSPSTPTSQTLLSNPQTAAAQTTPASSTGNFASLIQKASQQYGVNPDLINAVIRNESNFNPNAVSPVGAMGLMQLMPGTASSLGVTDPMNPAQNIDGGVDLLSKLLKRYDGKVDLALAAYNAGPGAVDEYHGIPPYQETQTYVRRILSQLGPQDSGGTAASSPWSK